MADRTDIFTNDYPLDQFLHRPDLLTAGGESAVLPETSTVANAISGGVDLGNTVSGSEVGAILCYGKTGFTDDTEGWYQGMDTDGKFKWLIGDGTSSVDWAVTAAGTLTVKGTIYSDAGTIGGWVITSGYIYNLQSGTPTSSPNDGIVLASGNEALICYEDTAKRLEVGYLSAGVYGLKVYDTGGSNVIFETSDTQQIIAGWTISTTTLANSTNIILDASNKAVSINSATWQAQGVQLQYNAGTPRAYIGDGGVTASDYYFMFDGTNIAWNAVATSLDTAGKLTTTSADIGGWNVVTGYIYNLQSGTPTSSPSDGVVLASGSEALIVYEDTAKRTELGYLSSGVYGLKVYATNGTDVIFEASDTQQKMAGWYFDTTSLADNTTAANAKIYIDSANTLIRAGATTGDYLTLDGANLRLRSSNYVTGVAGAGFTLEPDLLEVGNIACRGLFRTAVFQKDIISANAGSLIVVPNADVLAADMTALDASTLTIKGTAIFAVGDILRIKDGVSDEWLEVTSIASAPTYAVTRDKAAAYGADANPAWTTGATVVNYGASGDGGVLLTASDTNAPYVSVFDHAGAPWTTITTRLRLGNLNGFLGYSSDLYGIAIGSSTQYLKYDTSGGLVVRGDITADSGYFKTVTLGKTGVASGTLTLQLYATNGDTYINAGKTDFTTTDAGFILGLDDSDSDKAKFYLGDASNYLCWDGATLTLSGSITATSGTIGGFTVGSSDLSATAGGNTTTLSSGATAFSAGPTGSPTVTITQAGVLTATNATINGLSLAQEHIFGNGTDGDVTISVDTTLTADKFYDDLTVDAGVTLNPGGYRIFVRGTLTVNGTIARNGNDGGDGGNGDVGGIGVAGTAGTAATALSTGSLYGSLAGEPGGAGGSTGLKPGVAGDTGADQTIAMTTTVSSAGGAGGIGGFGAGGGAGGAGGTPTAAIRYTPGTVTYVHLMEESGSTDYLRGPAAAGGGGGGGCGADGGGTGGGGGGGGGSGTSGGILTICAKSIVVSASGAIRATGGGGGDGGDGGTGGGVGSYGGGGGGGGAGGNGGIIILMYGSYSNAGTVAAAGGTGGAKGAGAIGNAGNGSDGNDGNAGSVGRVITLQI